MISGDVEDIVEVKAGGLTFRGFAVSGLASFCMIPELGIIFDLGHCPLEALSYDTVYLSHIHQDHCFAIPRWLSLRQSRSGP